MFTAVMLIGEFIVYVIVAGNWMNVSMHTQTVESF